MTTAAVWSGGRSPSKAPNRSQGEALLPERALPMDPTVPVTDDRATHFAIIPVSVARDGRISDAAFRLYAALDGRMTDRDSGRIRQDTLAADLGWSRSKIQRATAELVAAGLVDSKRTSRSSRLAVVNPIRRPVDKSSSDASDLMHHEARCIRSDAADASDLMPPQINISLISNQQQSADPAPATPTPAGLADGSAPAKVKIGEYLAAITAATGAEISATKTVQRLLGRINRRGIPAADLGALTAAYLAVHRSSVDNVPGWLAGHVLPAIAEGELTEPPAAAKPTPLPPSPAELAGADRCDHGEMKGRCALCRRMLEPLHKLFTAAGIPDAEIIREGAGTDWAEISFTVPALPGSAIAVTRDADRVTGISWWPSDDCTLVGNVWAWTAAGKSLPSDYSATGSPGPGEPLHLERRRESITADDLRWFMAALPGALYVRQGIRDDLTAVAPTDAEISWDGPVATVTRDGRAIAHVSVDDESNDIASASWFVDGFPEYEAAARITAAEVRRVLPGTKGYGITVEQETAGEQIVAVHMDPLSGGREHAALSLAAVLHGFQMLEHLRGFIAQQFPAAPIPDPVRVRAETAEQAFARALGLTGVA